MSFFTKVKRATFKAALLFTILDYCVGFNFSNFFVNGLKEYLNFFSEDHEIRIVTITAAYDEEFLDTYPSKEECIKDISKTISNVSNSFSGCGLEFKLNKITNYKSNNSLKLNYLRFIEAAYNVPFFNNDLRVVFTGQKLFQPYDDFEGLTAGFTTLYGNILLVVKDEDISMKPITIHEMFHVFGIGHSDDKHSIRYPYYLPYQMMDDKGIEELKIKKNRIFL